MSEPITGPEEAEMRRVLEPLYGAQVNSWRITLRHYELLGILISEGQRCTSALHWVPRPYDWTNPLTWATKQARDAVRRALLSDPKQTYVICTKTIANKWATPFREAALEL